MRKQVVFYACILILSYSILIICSEETVIYLTEEDGIYEWIGTLFLLISAIIFLLLIIKNKESISIIYYIIFFLVLTFGFLEEIDWGQRIFNLQAPEILKGMSTRQINIHNIPLVEHSENGVRRLLSFTRIISICWLIYLFVIPVIDKYSVKVHGIINKYKFPVSPIWLGVFYILNHFINTACIYYFPNIVSSYIVEIKELYLELLLLGMSLSIYIANINKQKQIIAPGN